MRIRRSALASALLLTSVTAPAPGQITRSWQLGVSYVSITDPIWTPPSGHGEAQLGQSTGAYALRFGFFAFGDRAGFSGEARLMSTSFTDFGMPHTVDFPGAPAGSNPGTTTYTNPKYTLGGADLAVHWRPAAGKPFSFYALLDMVGKWESYELSGASFPDWNGSKSHNGFIYGYGGGARFVVGRHIALNADYRWLLGDAVYSCSKLGASLGNNWYECDEGRQAATKKTKLASVGLAFVW